jgi:hypothetical protein
MANETCQYNETVKTYNVISCMVDGKIVGYTSDKFTIEVVDGRIKLVNDDDSRTDMGTFIYSAQPLMNLDVIKTKCAINQTIEKVPTKLNVVQNKNTTNFYLKSNCLLYVVDNELKSQHDVMLSDAFLSKDNVLTQDGYDYCSSLLSSVDKGVQPGFDKMKFDSKTGALQMKPVPKIPVPKKLPAGNPAPGNPNAQW